MSYGLVGLYAIFFIFVGVNGNASALFSEIEKDARGFAPWVLALLVLRGLGNVKAINPVIKPFIALAVLTFIVRNYPKLITQVNEISGLKLPTGE